MNLSRRSFLKWIGAGAVLAIPVVRAVSLITPVEASPAVIPVVAGYKGFTAYDAGMFYCPYVPLMNSGVVVDPEGITQVQSFTTRYGNVEMTDWQAQQEVTDLLDKYGHVDNEYGRARF